MGAGGLHESPAVGGAATGRNTAVAVSSATSVGSAYFAYIFNGTYKATVGKMLLVGLGGVNDPTVYQAPASLSGVDVQVNRIKLGGTKRRPVIWMECGLISSKDKAARAGEIYNPNFISRDIAIQRLLEAKQMLDIGVYTQAQFDAEKAKYAPSLIVQ